MRVVEISDPASYHTAQWARQLIERNIETHVLYIDGWFDSKLDKVEGIEGCRYKLLKLPSKKSILLSLLKRGRVGTVVRSVRHGTMLHSNLEYAGPEINRYLKNQEIDVVHAHYVHGGGFIAYASEYLPCVLSTWGSDLTDGPKKYPHYIPLMKKTIEWATIINPASEVSAKLVKSFVEVGDNHIFVSSWGADTDFFKPDFDTRELKETLRIPDGPIILSFRALEPYYRIDIVLKAFNLVLQRHPTAVLIIGNDGPLRYDLEELAQSLGISARIVFTGIVVGEEMAKLFSMSDIYIQCPLSDGVSVSGMQALASGLAMIANDVGETEALVRNGYNGFLIDDTESPEDYADALIQILDDDSMLADFSRNSRAFAEEKHNRRKFLDKFEVLLRGLSEGASSLDEIF